MPKIFCRIRRLANMNRVALYIRLSVEDNGKDSDSIANQLKLGQEYLADHPSLQLIDTYIDNGYTGTNFERPEFNRMLQDAQSSKIDCIVVRRSLAPFS